MCGVVVGGCFYIIKTVYAGGGCFYIITTFYAEGMHSIDEI